MAYHPTKEAATKYMMLINPGPKARLEEPVGGGPEGDGRWVSGDQPAPGRYPGIQLAPPETATTVRAQDAKTLTTDGPFVETKEALDGYFVYEADDLDAAIELAARIPAARMGGAIEVRPIAEW